MTIMSMFHTSMNHKCETKNQSFFLNRKDINAEDCKFWKEQLEWVKKQK